MYVNLHKNHVILRFGCKTYNPLQSMPKSGTASSLSNVLSGNAAHDRIRPTSGVRRVRQNDNEETKLCALVVRENIT